MQIDLVRHAKVDLESTQKINASALHKWVQAYNNAPIQNMILPPEETLRSVQSTEFIVTSSLRRTHDTADLLGVKIDEQNPLFDEAGLPSIDIPLLKLRPKAWLVLLRMLLIFGIGKNDHSLKASKKQAQKATEHLLSLTQTYDHITLIGHGGMNYLIGKALQKRGWRREGKLSHKNLGVTRYVLPISS